MELQQLKYFCEVAKREHVTRTAEKLSILTAVIRCISVSKPNVRSRARFSFQRVFLLFQLESLEIAIVRVGLNDMGDRYEETGFIRM